MTPEVLNIAALVTLLVFMICTPVGAFITFGPGIGLLVTGGVGFLSSWILGSE